MRTLHLLTLLLAIAPFTGQAQERKCEPYPISEAEASQLLLSMDNAMTAVAMGGMPQPTSFVPRGGSRPRLDRFYFFVIFAGGGADNGLLGYYAVDKVTGRVFDTILLEDVTGKSFLEEQESLRVKHCVSAKMVDNAMGIEPLD